MCCTGQVAVNSRKEPGRQRELKCQHEHSNTAAASARTHRFGLHEILSKMRVRSRNDFFDPLLAL